MVHTVTLAAGSCLETAVLPYHLMRLQISHPDISVRVALSPRALDFVTQVAIEGVTGNPVYIENVPMDHGAGRAHHLELADADAVVIYPATARILAQCALGIVSCPVTRCFAFADKRRVIVTPYLHPRMEQRLYRPHIEVLCSIGCRIAQPDDELLWRDSSAWIATERLLGEVLADESSPSIPPSWSAG